MKSILAPIILSLLFSFFLLPSVTKLEQLHIPRILANLIMIFVSIAVMVGAGAVLSFAISGFIKDYPNYQPTIEHNLATLQISFEKITGLSPEAQRVWISENIDLADVGTQSVTSVVSGATSTVTILSLTFLYTFFLLYYRGKIKIFFQKLLRGRNEEAFMATLRKLTQVVPKYLSGVFWVMIVLSILSSLGFWAIGIHNPLFFGILTSILNIVPYAGATIGFGLVFLFALVTQSSTIAIGAVIMFIVVQIIDNNFLTPMITGSSIDINPLAAIIGIILGGALGGILGMIVALPILGMIKIICDSMLRLEPFGYLLGNQGTEEYEISWNNIKRLFHRK